MTNFLSKRSPRSIFHLHRRQPARRVACPPTHVRRSLYSNGPRNSRLCPDRAQALRSPFLPQYAISFSPLLELEPLFSSRIIVYLPRSFSVRLRISPRPSFATRLRGPPQRRQRYYTFLGDTYRRSGACAIVWTAICDCWKNHCPRCVRRRLDRVGPSSSCPASMSFSHPRHSYSSATWSRLATGRPRYIDIVIQDGNSIYIFLFANFVFGPRFIPLCHTQLYAFVKQRFGRQATSAPQMEATSHTESETQNHHQENVTLPSYNIRFTVIVDRKKPSWNEF